MELLRKIFKDFLRLVFCIYFGQGDNQFPCFNTFALRTASLKFLLAFPCKVTPKFIVSGTVAGIDSKLGGVSNFLRQVSNGGVSDMFGNFFRNLGQGNVSGLSIAGLVAAAFLIFGRFGWLGKIAGAFLGMMLIGNNAGVFRKGVLRKHHKNR